MRRSSVIISSISKWTEMILWYIRCKPCSYLASRLTLSPNGPKWASSWALSPRSTIGCIQNDIWAYGTFGQTLHLSCTNTNNISKWTERDSTWPTSPRIPSGVSKSISEPMVCLAQTMHISYINTNTIYKQTERDSTRPMSPRSSIRCVQNDFWAYGMFSANCAPILH